MQGMRTPVGGVKVTTPAPVRPRARAHPVTGSEALKPSGGPDPIRVPVIRTDQAGEAALTAAPLYHTLDTVTGVPVATSGFQGTRVVAPAPLTPCTTSKTALGLGKVMEMGSVAVEWYPMLESHTTRAFERKDTAQPPTRLLGKVPMLRLNSMSPLEAMETSTVHPSPAKVKVPGGSP